MKINHIIEKIYYHAGKFLFDYRKRKIDKKFFQEGYFLNKSEFEGINVYYFTNFKNKKDPKRPDLVLLHGFLDSSHTFRRVISYLKNDYNVYILDLPGHGKTKVPFIRELWRFTTLTRDIDFYMNSYNYKILSF